MVMSGEDVKFVENYSIKVIASNCNTEAAKDTSLPSNTYLIKSKKDDEEWYDIVMGLSCDIFDAYYDRFGDVIQSMEWTDGRRNPKLWGVKPKESKKKNGK